MSALTAVSKTFRRSLRLDFSQSDPVVAARNAVGVAIPLLIGVGTGNPAIGVFGAVGALFAAFADRPGSYRLRLARMSVTSLAAGLGGGLSVLFAPSVPLSLLLIAVFAFTTGMLLSFGINVSQIGTAATAVAIVLNRFPLPASGALGIAVLVTAAGLVQSLLATAGWPLHRHAPERAVLADLYEGLAGRTRSPHPKMTAPGAGRLLETARATITGFGHGHGPSMQSYRGLLDEAERIRLEVMALGYCIERFERVERTAQRDAVRDLLLAAGTVLDAVAGSLRRGRAFDQADLHPATDALTRFEDVMAGHPDSPTGRFASLHARALAGQLRACGRMVTPGAVEGRIVEETAKVGGVRVALQAPFGTLRANLRWDSAIARHAIRLAVLVTATDGFARLLPGNDRGYWISLMVLLLLRPDFAATLHRTSARLAGTLVGLGIGTAGTYLLASQGHYALVGLIVVFVFGVRVSGAPNAFFMGIWTAAYLVALLDLAGIPAADVAGPRLLDTLLAGALVVAATIIWPAWERAYLPARVAELLAAYRNYLVTITDPASKKAAIDAARIAARLARSNAQASLDRTQAEPVPGRDTQYVGEGVLVQSHLLIQAAMVIDAARLSMWSGKQPVEGMLAPVAPFIADCSTTLAACGRAAAEGVAPRGAVNMRASYVALKDSLEAHAMRPDVVQPAILDAADRIANAVDTMVHLLRERPAPAA
ncbi:FUSC family protein [Specibacter cremeus]|uniref:FUSC family protein n=1 Tax=Specibacter cremeus TaxID=1629051 RepID=UPI000F7A836D|nr:FUSC family protein [Specibacter cremeus]